MTKVSKEVAQKDIESWLDFKQVSEKKRESNKDSIESLIEAISEGILSLSDDHKIIHKLKSPIENKDGDVTVESLEYIPKLKVKNTISYLQGVKGTDVDGRLVAYVCALTSKPSSVIREMDTEDYSVSQSIAIFFL